ncbi:MAG TPA: hypothetical protein VLS51_11090 [Propionibacteriaceae bacterium]|nr:hypothetical protein [Propionibacteriaceae bacterium]
MHAIEDAGGGGFDHLRRPLPDRPGPPRGLHLVGLVVWPLVAVVVVVAFFLGVRHLAQSGAPLFVIDEHVHVDYVAHLWEGKLPYRGVVYDPRVVHEAQCGVGLVAPPAGPCGPNAGTGGPLSGQYSAEYIHYPTYFALAALVVRPPQGGGVDVTGLRLYSSFVFLAGLLSLWLLGLVARLGGVRLAAVVSVPAASAIFFLMGGYFNPSAASLLAGGLVAAGGLAWLRSPRGFWFFLAATALASVTAVTSVMPAGAFFLYGLWVYGRRLLRRRRDAGWTPTWWQLVSAALVVVVPWYVWGRYIAASATVDNKTLYGFAAVTSKGQILRSTVSEALTLHTPWYAVPSPEGVTTPGVWHAWALNVQQTLPLVITVLVLGGLAAAVIGWAPSPVSLGEPSVQQGEPLARRDLVGVAAALLLVIWAYPPLLHVTNVLTFGFDYPIVARYSMSFTPLLVVLALLLLPRRAYAWALALTGLGMLAAMAYTLPLQAK